jgi:hypothetical protein
MANIVDPVWVFKTTSSLLIPHPTTTSVAPIPTVVPDPPRYERVGETGTKTLWVCCHPRPPYHQLTLNPGCLRHHVTLYPRIHLHGLESPSCKLTLLLISNS